jgi:hypothetical protein
MGSPDNYWVGGWSEEIDYAKGGYATDPCDAPPEHPEWRCHSYNFDFMDLPNGEHQLFAYGYYICFFEPAFKVGFPSFDVVDFVVDIN